MTQTLYNLRNDGDQWRISKFVDGELESSYLCSEVECECPAGVRPSCRHRQMLPQMLAHKIQNSFYFWDFDRGYACDFQGGSKQLVEQVALGLPAEEPAEEETLTITVSDGGEPMHLFGKGGIVTEYHNHATPRSKWRRF